MESHIASVRSTLIYERRAASAQLSSDVKSLRTLDRHHELRQVWWRRAAWLTAPSGLVGAFVFLAPAALEAVPGLGIDPVVLQFGFMAVVLALSWGIAYVRKQDRPKLQDTVESKAARWLVPLAGFVIPIAAIAAPLSAELAEPLALAAVPASLVFIWLYRHHSRLNLEDRRYALVDWLLDMLSADVDSQSEMSLKLDLAPADAKHKLVSSVDGFVKLNSYEDPWLEMSGRFVDGTTFVLRWVDKVKTKTRVKRKGRIKKKRSSKCVISLQLRVKPEKQPYLAKLAEKAKTAIQVPASTLIRRVEVDGRSLFLQVAPSDVWEAGDDDDAPEQPKGPPGYDYVPEPVRGEQVVAMMFLSLYQVLNLSRAVTKKEAA